MDRKIIILKLMFVHGVLSVCPILSQNRRLENDFDFYKGYSLYQYMPVDDPQLFKSPFYVVEGKSNMVQLWGSGIQSFCYFFDKTYNESVNGPGKTDKISYNDVSLFDFNTNLSKFKLNYTGDNLFCNENNTMDELFVIDYQRSHFVSFYGCKSFIIDGKLKTFKGVLIFLVRLFGQPHNATGLNYTYKILQDRLNISQTSLRTIPVDLLSIGPYNNCDDIRNFFVRNDECKRALEAFVIAKEEALESAVEAKKNFPFTVLWYLILVVVILQIVHQVLMFIKRNFLNVI